MRTKSLIILLSLFFALPLSGSAQVRNLLKKKTGEKAEKNIEEGMLNLSNKLFKKSIEEDKAVVKSDSISDENITEDESIGNSDENQQVNSALLNLMTGGGSDIKHEDSYVFDISVKMLVEGEQTEGQGKMFFTSYYNSKTNDVAISFESSGEGSDNQGEVKVTTILDHANNCGIMLTNQSGQKMAIVTDMDEEEDSEMYYEEEDADINDIKYNKTGKSKSILGYKCYEYEYSNAIEKGVFWVTDELKLMMDKKAAEKSGMPALVGEGPLEGMVTMEMFFYNEEGESSHMLVTEVNMNTNKTISLSGYNVMSVGGDLDN